VYQSCTSGQWSVWIVQELWQLESTVQLLMECGPVCLTNALIVPLFTGDLFGHLLLVLYCTVSSGSQF